MKRVINKSGDMINFYDASEVGGKAKARALIAERGGYFNVQPMNGAFYFSVRLK